MSVQWHGSVGDENQTDVVVRCEVALLIGDLPPQGGGAERQVMRLAGKLAEEGRKVVIIARGCDDAALPIHSDVIRIDPETCAAAAQDRGMSRAHSIQVRLRGGVVGRIWKRMEQRVLDVLLVRLVARARRKRHRAAAPSVVDGVLLLFARRRMGRKFRAFDATLRTVQATCVLSFLALPNLYAAVSLRHSPARLVVSHRNDPRSSSKDEPFASMEYLAYTRADLVTANSRGALDALASLPELTGRPMALAPNVGEGPMVESAGAARRFLVIGRLAAHKNVDRAVRCFADAVGRLQGWALVIAGTGPEEQRLNELARALGVEERVEFRGFVSDVPALLREGGVLLHLSGYEGTPNAIMEAMSAGLPSIVTDASPGPVELVAGGGPAAGIVCRDGDLEAVEVAMVRLASDDALRGQLGAEALRRAEGSTWPALREEWLSILDLTG